MPEVVEKKYSLSKMQKRAVSYNRPGKSNCKKLQSKANFCKIQKSYCLAAMEECRNASTKTLTKEGSN